MLGISIVQTARVLRKLDSNTVISHQVTSSGGGLIFPREFLIGIKHGIVCTDEIEYGTDLSIVRHYLSMAHRLH